MASDGERWKEMERREMEKYRDGEKGRDREG